MAIEPDVDGYLSSVANELEADAYRVRCLIGSRHWLSDGTHKEAVLAGVLGRFLPSDFLVTKGFVRARGRETHLSLEQDILIVDISQEAPLFHEHGLTICSPESVLATISVKSGFKLEAIRSSVSGWKSAVPGVGFFDNIPLVFYGAYFFNGREELSEATVRSAAKHIIQHRLLPSRPDIQPGIESLVACSSGHVFICNRTTEGTRLMVVHRSGKMAPAVLIANVARFASLRRGGGVPEIVAQLDDLRFSKVLELKYPDD